MKNRYSNFIENQSFHSIRKKLRSNKEYSYRRYLNPQNPRSTHKDFYSPKILVEFDKHYKKRSGDSTK